MPGGKKALQLMRKLGRKGKKALRGGRGKRRGRGRRLQGSHVAKIMMLKNAVGTGSAFQAIVTNWLSKIRL